MATNNSTAKNRTRSQSVRSGSGKKKLSIRAARYLNGFSVAVTFSTGITQLVNFLPLLEKNLKGQNLKYFSLERFKEFMVRNGRICWGNDEELAFPAETIFKKMPSHTNSSPGILYAL